MSSCIEIDMPSKLPLGQGSPRKDGYKRFTAEDGTRMLEHVYVAEKALGRKLPKGAIVHHVDENRGNNINTNLVVCPDQAYHKLIHRRLDAFKATGNYDARKCMAGCGQWDLPENMVPWGKRDKEHYAHKECRNRLMREYNAKKRNKS